MLIRERMAHKRPVFSFEVRVAAGEHDAAWRALEQLAPLAPDFVVIDCGALRTFSSADIAFLGQLRGTLGVEPAARLCWTDEPRWFSSELAECLAQAGVYNLIVTGPGMFEAAAYFQKFGAFCVGGELDANGLDLRSLARAADVGLDFVIVPVGHDLTLLQEVARRAGESGLRLPVVPGVRPVTQGEDDEDPQETFWSGVSQAAQQCRELLHMPRSDPFLQQSPGPLSGIHIYTVNRSLAGRALFDLLRLAQPCGN